MDLYNYCVLTKSTNVTKNHVSFLNIRNSVMRLALYRFLKVCVCVCVCLRALKLVGREKRKRG